MVQRLAFSQRSGYEIASAVFTTLYCDPLLRLPAMLELKQNRSDLARKAHYLLWWINSIHPAPQPCPMRNPPDPFTIADMAVGLICTPVGVVVNTLKAPQYAMWSPAERELAQGLGCLQRAPYDHLPWLPEPLTLADGPWIFDYLARCDHPTRAKSVQWLLKQSGSPFPWKDEVLALLRLGIPYKFGAEPPEVHPFELVHQTARLFATGKLLILRLCHDARVEITPAWQALTEAVEDLVWKAQDRIFLPFDLPGDPHGTPGSGSASSSGCAQRVWI